MLLKPLSARVILSCIFLINTCSKYLPLLDLFIRTERLEIIYQYWRYAFYCKDWNNIFSSWITTFFITISCLRIQVLFRFNTFLSYISNIYQRFFLSLWSLTLFTDINICLHLKPRLVFQVWKLATSLASNQPFSRRLLLKQKKYT